MITVVIGSETWCRKHGWVFSLSCLSLSFFGLLFNQLDWSTCFSKLSQRCNIHFAEVKSTVHTLLDSVVYKWFCVDLKVVGIFYLGAFLITNGSCVMMPIMSVVQQGGCNPSCRLMLEQQRIYTTGFCLWWFAVSHTTYLCLFAGLWSCCPFKWVVWVPWSGWFCPLLSHLLAWLLFFLPSANGAKTSGGMMPLRKEPVNACPTCQAKYLSFGVPPPYLLLLLFPPHHHHLPRILENRKYILLSDGWAPCSCWEERKKAFLSLQGSQMSLAVSKLRVGSAFSGASWNARSPSAWKLQALLHYVCGKN